MRIALLLIVLAGCGGSKPQPANAAPAPAASNPVPAANPAAEPPASSAAPAAPADAAPAAPVGIAALRARLEQLSDEMCNCKDAACARHVSDEMSRWGAEVTQANGGAVLSQADTDQIMPIAKRLAACMSDAMTKGNSSGSTP